MPKLRTVSPLHVTKIAEACLVLRTAREMLKLAGAKQAAKYVQRALKSAEGALRHAQRAQSVQEARGISAAWQSALPVQPAKMLPLDTPIILKQDGPPFETRTTLKEFVNANNFESEEVGEMLTVLGAGNTYKGGGGAAPEWSISRAMPDVICAFCNEPIYDIDSDPDMICSADQFECPRCLNWNDRPDAAERRALLLKRKETGACPGP